MKLIPITIERENNYDCFDILINAICKWKKIDHRMIFSESWGFMYESIKDNSFIISNNLSVNRGDELYYLKNYHGMDIKTFDFSSEATLFIKEEIKNNLPVILKVDVFWCPWMFGHYKTQHADHFIIINGYDEKTEKFYCLDNQLAINGKEFPECDLLSACKEVLYIRFEDKIIGINTKSILSNSINRLSDNKGNFQVGKRIEIFSKDLLYYMDLDKEVLNYKNVPSTALLFQLIAQIGKGRHKFSLALEYIQNVNNDLQLSSIIKMLQAVSIKWNEVVAMLIKAYFIKNRDKMFNRIYLKLIDIKNFEEDIALNIKRIINDKAENVNSTSELILKEGIQFSPRYYEFIDITNYLNNNGVYKEESTYCDSELSNPNRYFVPKFIIKNNEIHIDKMRFMINNFINNEFDNIACEGQEIEANIEGHDKLMVLICSEFGNFDENLEIYYDNDEKELIDLKTTTWLSASSRQDNQIALPGKGVVRDKDRVNVYPFDVNIYACHYNLKQQETKIKKIKLPDCINIHIFAITFGK